MIFTESVTVYNIIPQFGREPQRIQRSLVRGVFWDAAYGTVCTKAGKETQDTAMLMIRHSPAMLPPHKWTEAGYPTDKYTLKAGDIIVRGEYGDIDSPADAERLNAEFIVVTSVRNCCYGSKTMWHWEVTGK